MPNPTTGKASFDDGIGRVIILFWGSAEEVLSRLDPSVFDDMKATGTAMLVPAVAAILPKTRRESLFCDLVMRNHQFNLLLIFDHGGL